MDEKATIKSSVTTTTTPNGKANSTAFWNVNVPPGLQTQECPDFLRYAFTNPKDRGILSTPDSEYQRHAWQQVQQLIHDNRLNLFELLPSDLRRYREYCAKVMKEYGTVMAFVMQERMKWRDLTPQGRPFTEPGMYFPVTWGPLV